MTRLAPTLCIVVALAAGCHRSPRRAAFLRSFDQLDLAPWEALCGPRFDGVSPIDGDPTTELTTLSSPPRSPWTSCIIDRHAGGQRIRSIRLDIEASAPKDAAFTRARHAALRELVRPLVPPEVWPHVLMVSEASKLVDVGAYGFSIDGGFQRSAIGQESWTLQILAWSWSKDVRAGQRADLAAIDDATRDEAAQQRLVDALEAPARKLLSDLIEVDLVAVARRSASPCATSTDSVRGESATARREGFVHGRILWLEAIAGEVTRITDRLIADARRYGGRDRLRTIARLVAIDRQFDRRVAEAQRLLPCFDDDELWRVPSIGDSLEVERLDATVNALLRVPLAARAD